MFTFIRKTGRAILNYISYFGSLGVTTIDAFKNIFSAKKSENIFKHIDLIGVRSFPLVGIISVFIGMVLVMETAYTLKRFGAEIYSGGIVSVSMIRELGPVFVAIIMAGRVGGSIAAEIGTMKITEQIDAMEILAVDPVAYLVSPRLLAGIISLPSLFLMSFFLAIAGAAIVGILLVNIPSGMFFYQTFRFIGIRDMIVGLVKSIVFAIVVIGVASHEGLRAVGGASGVGNAATTSVVVSFFLIILCNLILTGLFYFV
ncbi:MAG: ABC transporter permease [Candidatus Ratteibacteria bacterium]|nr:ABC transporter permease [Candidatus Ratteibacteria bacterium]